LNPLGFLRGGFTDAAFDNAGMFLDIEMQTKNLSEPDLPIMKGGWVLKARGGIVPITPDFQCLC